VKKSSRRSFRRGKSHKAHKWHENWQTKEKSKEKLKTKTNQARKAQTQKLKTPSKINSA
jgi:hypothetical protein